jgi:hypothetical protein
MAGFQQRIPFSKVMEILPWLAGLGVLAENILLFRQNRHLSEALAPQNHCENSDGQSVH